MKREGIVIHATEEARKNYKTKTKTKKTNCPNCNIRVKENTNLITGDFNEKN